MKNKTIAILLSGMWISLGLIFVISGAFNNDYYLQALFFITPCIWMIMVSFMSDLWRDFNNKLVKDYHELSSAYQTLYKAFLKLKQEEISRKVAEHVDKKILKEIWKPHKKSKK